jgi:hypothetical protein
MKSLVLAVVFLCIPCPAQNPSSGDASTSGTCSPAISGNNNTVTIQTCGNPEETKKLVSLIKALFALQGDMNYKLDELLQVVGKPPKIISSNFSQSRPPSGKPRAALDFYTEDPIDRGQFEVTCDRPCIPIQTCRLEGSNNSLFATVQNHSEIAEFLFQRQFPAFTKCTLAVESLDDLPISIRAIRAIDSSRRHDGIIPTKLQPQHLVNANGSTIQ